MTAPEQVITDVILPRLQRVQSHGSWWSASCPVQESHRHGDKNPSLTIAVGRQQPVVMRCHKVDTMADILAAIGLAWRDVCNGAEQRDPEAIFSYVDEQGSVLYQAVRFPGKQLRMRQPDGHGGWIWSVTQPPVRNVPFNLPALIAARRQKDCIWVVEGEKDVRSFTEAGEIATCHRNGASARWPAAEYAAWFEGHDVLIVADNDDAGRTWATRTRAAMLSVHAILQPEFAWIVSPAVTADKADATDHFNAGFDVGDFVWWAQ